ncbi:hypothetical protein RHGRI_006689 [Rhododendron griersonianum]|uniref:CCHC-type domain-containing protein n=1 Tax=Rhododendron griersonianum TaxID=479676 RepID=A0AAV6KU10_9ERIC|nr:hypothetical protein RHGRI_006689 [Rhododendron griersonianum]
MPCDDADESCVANAIGNLCQSFLLSYGVRVSIRNLLRAFKLACGKSFSSLLDLKDLADVVDQEDIAKLSDAVKELNSMRLMTQLYFAETFLTNPVGGSGLFTMQIHQWGKFFNVPRIKYEGGSIAYVDNCNRDTVSLLEVGDLVEQLGYTGMINYYYVMTGRTINNGLKMLLSDKDVLDMIDQLPPSRVVDIYIEPVSPLLMMQTQDSSTDKAGLSGPSDKAGPNGPSDKVGPPDIGLGPNLNYEDLLFDDGDLEDVDIGDVDSSESDASFFEDSDYARSDDDELFEAFVDDGIEWEGLGKNKGKEKEVNEEVNMEVDDGEDYGDVSSEDLHSVYSDSDDEVKDKNPEFRAETDMGKVKFCPGMKFSNAKEFREAVREYAIKKGKDIKFVKNETTRIKAICAAEECPWSIMGSLAQKGESFQVKTYKKKHKCLRSFRVRHVTSMYLANKYVDSIRSNPDMPLEHLQERVRKDIVVNVSTTQAYRAKRKALDLIEGTHLEQYALLRGYCEEVRRTNPNTTIIINTIPPPTEDGIPCTHAITAITHKHANIEDYIDSCYKKETNASIYRGIIYPINGRSMWHASGCVPILPPNYGRSSGRPKKCRRKERAELENPDPDKLRRQNTSLRCGKCGQWGHNMRTCKNEANPEIRRRPTGGLVFTRPSGRPRGRPRRGGVQSTFGRGRSAVGDGAAPQSSQASVGTDGAAPQATQASQVSVGTVGIDGGRTRGGRGMGTDGGGTRGGRGRGRSIGGSSGGSTDVGRGSGGGNKGGRTGGGRGRAGRGSGVGTRGGSTDGGRGRTGRGKGRPVSTAGN